MTRRMRFAVRLWPWVLAVLILAPALAPGYVLSYDMVFVPDLALRSDFLGLGTSLPRAVPSDAVVAVLDEVVPGMLVQKVVLLAALVLAGTGARRLVPADSGVAQLAATSLYVWNPYVAERLVLGHWPTLLAYAALPWVVDAARRWRTGEAGFASVVLWLALGSIGASGGVMTAIAALAIGARARSRAGRRRTLALVLAVVAVNAPWVVAGLLHPDGAVSDPTGVDVFAAGPEGGLPAPLAWLGLGGVWNVEAVPGSRLGVLGWVSLVVVVALCVAGARLWWQTLGRRTASGLLACAVVGLTLAAVGGLLPDALAWIVVNVPGGGLLRDGSRYLGLLAVTEASLFGFGAVALSAMFRDPLARRSLAVGAVLAPLALLPDLAVGVSGRLGPVSYPSAYDTARSVLAAEDEAGDLLVLPLTSYRAPEWNDGRKVLDPLGRYMTPNYVASDVLSVSGRMLRGEDPRAADALTAIRASNAQDRATALGRLGIRYVLTDTTAPGANLVGDYTADVPGRRLFEGGGLELISLQVPVRIVPPSTAAMIALAGAWATWAISLAAALVTIVLTRVHGPLARRHRSKAPTPR